MAAPASREDKVALYRKLVATHPASELKGDTVPYTSVNGHMYSYISKEGNVALRLPADVREAFLAKYDAQLMAAYGIVQKEYVAIPGNLLGKTSTLKPYFAQSYDYVSSLKPKPTAKKKK